MKEEISIENRATTTQRKIIECIDAWEAKGSGNPFSWVDDMLSTYDYDIYYCIHCAWVDAWNKSERLLPMSLFLRKWASIENITHVLDGME